MQGSIGGDAYMDKSQMLKGILEGCTLKIIGKTETYGYDIVTQLQSFGFTDIKEGTLYPLLLKDFHHEWKSITNSVEQIFKED